MGECLRRIRITGLPVFLHRAPREFEILVLAFVRRRPVDQFDDVVQRGVGRFRQHLRLRRRGQFGRHHGQQFVERGAQLFRAAERVGGVARAARILDLLHACRDGGEVGRHFSARAPQVDLEHERVQARARGQHPVERRVRHHAAVPVTLAVDLHRVEAGRQRAAGHHVLRADAVFRIVEVGEVARPDVDGADRQAHLARVDAIEVDEALQGRAQRRRVVETRRAGPWPRQVGRRHARLEKAGHALHEHAARRDLVDPGVQRVDERHAGPLVAHDAVAGRADQFPEFAQAFDPLLARIARDDRAVDGADRNAGHPRGLDARFQQLFVHAGLVRTERAAALQHEGDAVEFGGAGFRYFGGRPCAFVQHAFIPCVHVPAPSRSDWVLFMQSSLCQYESRATLRVINVSLRSIFWQIADEAAVRLDDEHHVYAALV